MITFYLLLKTQNEPKGWRTFSYGSESIISLHYIRVCWNIWVWVIWTSTGGYDHKILRISLGTSCLGLNINFFLMNLTASCCIYSQTQTVHSTSVQNDRSWQILLIFSCLLTSNVSRTIQPSSKQIGLRRKDWKNLLSASAFTLSHKYIFLI